MYSSPFLLFQAFSMEQSHFHHLWFSSGVPTKSTERNTSLLLIALFGSKTVHSMAYRKCTVFVPNISGIVTWVNQSHIWTYASLIYSRRRLPSLLRVTLHSVVCLEKKLSSKNFIRSFWVLLFTDEAFTVNFNVHICLFGKCFGKFFGPQDVEVFFFLWECRFD